MTVTVSLVVEHNVRSPDLVWWNSNELNPVKLCRYPPQLVVIPNLRKRKRKTLLVFCRVNLFCVFHCTPQTVLLVPRDRPSSWEYSEIHIYTAGKTSFDVLEPNQGIAAPNLRASEGFHFFFTENQAQICMFLIQSLQVIEPQSFSTQIISHLKSSSQRRGVCDQIAHWQK